MNTRDRRQFIQGQWIPQSARVPTPEGTLEIASILVQARPEKIDVVARSIEALPGAEIYQRDPRGKLVVVLEFNGSDPIGETMTQISLLPHVITATLVYHIRETPDQQPGTTAS